MAPRKSPATEPRIVDLPRRTMAVVHGKGPPDQFFAQAMPALFGSVYALKFDLKKKDQLSFKVAAPCARYHAADLSDKQSWAIAIGIPVPDQTVSLPQKAPGMPVTIEAWDYGATAEVLHLGPYDQEAATVERLLAFVRESGYEVFGDHEEEYLTRPGARVMKTMIRLRVKKGA